jgi:hypothetical protein
VIGSLALVNIPAVRGRRVLTLGRGHHILY